MSQSEIERAVREHLSLRPILRYLQHRQPACSEACVCGLDAAALALEAALQGIERDRDGRTHEAALLLIEREAWRTQFYGVISQREDARTLAVRLEQELAQARGGVHAPPSDEA